MSTNHINAGSLAGNGLRSRVHSVITARVHGRAAVATAVVRVVAGLVFALTGVRVGGPIHLGLAPTLLVAMVFLLWAGAGSLALDNRIAAHR